MMMSNTTTARLLDGALGDMVAVSTPRSATDGAEEGASWWTVRRMASSYTQEDLNLWWSVDAGYLLIDEEKKKAAPAPVVVAAVGAVSAEEEEGDNDNEEEEEAVSRRLLMAQVTPPSPAVTISVEEAAPAAAAVVATTEEKRIRLFAYCSAPAAPKQKNWGGAVPAKKALRAPKKTIKKMRVAFPVGDGDTATLAHGALVYGMVGGKREERRRMIEAARELRKAPKVWAREIEATLNELMPENEELLSFGSGANDDLELRKTGKGVTKHAVAIMAALDHLRAPENSIRAAARGILVRWPETLPKGVQRCVALHPYLDAWAKRSW
jgi:hypothetical protein